MQGPGGLSGGSMGGMQQGGSPMGGGGGTLGSTSSQGPVLGGGAILGVSSASEREGLKIFNEKKKYKEWFFIYDPIMEASNSTGGFLIKGPYTGKTFGSGGGIGVPAGQLASPNQPSGFGQPIGTGFGGTSSPGTGGSSFGGTSPGSGNQSPTSTQPRR
jgi:hypothetical protein